MSVICHSQAKQSGSKWGQHGGILTTTFLQVMHLAKKISSLTYFHLRLNAIASGDVIEMLSANEKAIILLLCQLPINSLKSASKSNLSKKTADLVVRLVLIGFEPSPPIAKLLLSESLPLRTRC